RHAYNSIPILGIILETLGTGAAHVVLLRPVCPLADGSSEATYCGNQELPQLLRRKDGRRVRTQLNSHTRPDIEHSDRLRTAILLRRAVWRMQCPHDIGSER